MKKIVYPENDDLCIVTKQKTQYKIDLYKRCDVLDAYLDAKLAIKRGEKTTFFTVIRNFNPITTIVPLDDPALSERLKNGDYFKESGDTLESLRRILDFTTSVKCEQCINCDSCVLNCPPCKTALFCPMFKDKNGIYNDTVAKIIRGAAKTYTSCFYTKENVVDVLTTAGFNEDILSEVGCRYFAILADPRPFRSYIRFYENEEIALHEFEDMKERVMNECEYKSSSISTSTNKYIERKGVHNHQDVIITAQYGHIYELFI